MGTDDAPWVGASKMKNNINLGYLTAKNSFHLLCPTWSARLIKLNLKTHPVRTLWVLPFYRNRSSFLAYRYQYIVRTYAPNQGNGCDMSLSGHSVITQGKLVKLRAFYWVFIFDSPNPIVSFRCWCFKCTSWLTSQWMFVYLKNILKKASNTKRYQIS